MGRKFPHVNDNADFVARSRRRNRMQLANCVVRCVVIVILVVAWWFVLMGVLDWVAPV